MIGTEYLIEKEAVHKCVRLGLYEIYITAHCSFAYLVIRAGLSEFLCQRMYITLRPVNEWISVHMTASAIIQLSSLGQYT